MSTQGGVVRILSIVFELTKTIIALTVIVFLIHFFIGTIFVVDGPSMDNNLHSGEILWVNKLAYLTHQPKRGDIVVLRFPGDPAKDRYVKRIVGLPGETVDIKGYNVYINGQKLNEPYLPLAFDMPASEYTVQHKHTVLKSKEYFLLGDNRPVSSDSRVWGQARQEDLIGATRLIIFPFKYFGYVPRVFY
jgi:signal peptidase I